MRRFSAPVLVDSLADSNITDLLLRQTGIWFESVLFHRQHEQGQWQGITAGAFLTDVRLLAKGLMASGIQAGDRVGIMSRTRYEWTLVDFAIWFAGAVSVPIYETSSPAQVAWNLGDSGAVALVIETTDHEEAFRAAAQHGMGSVENLWRIDDGGLDELRAAASTVSDDALEQRRRVATLDDLATIVYTSGTTGKPKGCELTHGNFVRLADNAIAAMPELAFRGASTIMFLPLAHIFARLISVLAVAAGVSVAHTPDLKNLLGDLQSYRPTFILAVPRVFEKVYNSAQLKAESTGRGRIFGLAAETAIAHSRATQHGRVTLGLRLRHVLFDALVYAKLRQAMGGQVSYAISGGGPLGERLGHFFHGIGIKVLEGYGLTETTAPITVNIPALTRIGTVGIPLPGNAVRIGDDGEVLAKGVSLMRGYYQRDDLTQEALDEGWFRTGDLGELDDQGYLRITGRKKEIIVTAGGKNVSPALLEDDVRSYPLVSQCMLLGDRRPFISALVTLDEDALPGWLERHDLPRTITMADLSRHPVMIEEIQTVIDRANESVSKAEQIKAFRILPRDFTESTGHLTPSLKLRRTEVLKDHSDVVEDMYTAPPPLPTVQNLP